MTNTRYCLTWDLYKNNICNGFAQLQQREEFVDMTLVAEGHLVRVHKNIISLASPFIKNIIKATPCMHPIVFLINMTHDILCHLLEYIYTGEVHVELDRLDEFIKAAKELQLSGIDYDLSFSSTLNNRQCTNTTEAPKKYVGIQTLENRSLNNATSNHVIDKNTNNGQHTNIPEALPILKKFKNRLLDEKTEIADNKANASDILDTEEEQNYDINIKDYLLDTENFNEFLKFPNAQNLMVNENSLSGQHELQTEEIGHSEEELQHEISLQLETNTSIPQQYTISTKGSIQLILNRYMYSMQYSANCGQKRRWRCIDYRLLHCQAYIDTLNDTIIKRKNSHIHPFHDYKIMNKIKAKLIYGSLSTAIHETTKLKKNENEDIEMVESE